MGPPPGRKPETEVVEHLKKMLPQLTLDVRAAFEAAETQRKKKEHQDGLIGRLIGSARAAPYSIALIVVLLCFGFLAIAMLYPSSTPEQEKIVQGMQALLTITVGYLFGYRTSGRK